MLNVRSITIYRKNARKEIDSIVKEIYGIGRPGFRIDKDFVLKTCLVLFVDNIRFQLKNFTYENVQVV